MPLASNFEEVAENARIFNLQVEVTSSMANKAFGRFSNWYYFPDIDIFAPNKFIGYSRDVSREYNSSGHGTEAKSHLQKWFRKLDDGQGEYSAAKDKLITFAQRLDKKINSKTFDETSADGGGIFVALINCPEFEPLEELGKPENEYVEGAVKQILVNRFERNPKARAECLKHHGIECYSCGFDFEQVYGQMGAGFIHVHHLKELSEIRTEYIVNPIRDMLPLCPNCHAMVHKSKPAMHPQKLKEQFFQNKL